MVFLSGQQKSGDKRGGNSVSAKRYEATNEGGLDVFGTEFREVWEISKFLLTGHVN